MQDAFRSAEPMGTEFSTVKQPEKWKMMDHKPIVSGDNNPSAGASAGLVQQNAPSCRSNSHPHPHTIQEWVCELLQWLDTFSGANPVEAAVEAPVEGLLSPQTWVCGLAVFQFSATVTAENLALHVRWCQ